MSGTKIDITNIPFSRYGAYVAVTREQGKNAKVLQRNLLSTVPDVGLKRDLIKSANPENIETIGAIWK